MTLTSRSIAPVLTPLADRDLETLLTIRHFERRLLDLFAMGKVRGTAQTCLGQEHIPTAVMANLTEQDFVLSHHRSQGHFLARFGDAKGLLAEIMGKRGAIGSGVGGCQHLFHRNFLSTGIAGELVPVAAGIALGLHRKGTNGLAAVFVGDGTWGEGVVYEALNIAQLWSLPLVIVVESERPAAGAASNSSLAGTITGRAKSFGASCLELCTVDVNEIRAALAEPLAAVRSSRHPLVVEFPTRCPAPDGAGVPQRNWYEAYREVDGAQMERIEAKVLAELERIVSEVDAAPPSEWSES